MIRLPSRDAHLYWDMTHFGRTYPKIHRELDKGFKTHGRKHRSVSHTFLHAIEAAQKHYPGDAVAVRAALWHLYLDDVCSVDLDFRDTVEAAAKLAKMRRRRRRRFY